MSVFRITILLVTAGICLGCSQDSEDDGQTGVDPLGPGEVAIVNGGRIPESIFRLHTLNSLQAEADNLTPEAREQMVEQLVIVRLLADQAEINGLTQERRIAAELELYRLQYLARAMADRYTEENAPTESELRDLYEFNLPRLRAAQYRTRHILVDSEELAVNLIEQLDQGADFAELAMEHGTDSTAADGGDLGWLSADSVVEPFAVAMQAATAGELPDAPVETQYGWHLILVEEIEEQVAPGLESVREELIRAAETQKLDAFAAGLREAAEVIIADE